MITVSVQLTSINAERLAEVLPQKIQFNINLALPSNPPYHQDSKFIIPFTFTLSSMPPVVQIILKGNAIVISDNKEELENLEKDLKKKNVPPMIVQAVFTAMITESIIISRSLGTPPPIPGLPPIPGQQGRDSKKSQDFSPGTVI